MKVLVTGATGGLGELVVNLLLEKGIDVIATSCNWSKAKECLFYSKVNYIPLDFNFLPDTDLFSFFDKPDSVIHLAWGKLNEYNSADHRGMILHNHETFFLNLVKNGLQDFNGIGTCYEYGIREGILKEEFESKPVLEYAGAKNELRKFIEDQHTNYCFSNKWIRIFYMFGEVKGRRNLYSLLLDSIKKNDSIFNMSGGEQIRDFLSPNEISEIIVKISLQNKIQGIINCCSGKPVKVINVVTDFIKKYDSNLKLNLGFFPYLSYEPLQSWGSVEKLNKISH